MMRIAVRGLLVLVPSLIWLIHRTRITWVEVAWAAVAVAIGAALTYAGITALIRARSRREQPIPPAIARVRR